MKYFREKYGLEVYLEPGEAVVLNAGFWSPPVLEIVHNGMDIAILDTSAACHMPDVLEMPYRPPVKDSGKAGEKPYTYRLAGPTCLAGGCYRGLPFDHPLAEGSQIVLEDMALYTMVKTNTFNGMPLPTIALRHEDGAVEVVKEFGYEDFKSRLRLNERRREAEQKFRSSRLGSGRLLDAFHRNAATPLFKRLRPFMSGVAAMEKIRRTAGNLWLPAFFGR